MIACGFDKLAECNEQCKYFATCTRNPHNQTEEKIEYETAKKLKKQGIKKRLRYCRVCGKPEDVVEFCVNYGNICVECRKQVKHDEYITRKTKKAAEPKTAVPQEEHYSPIKLSTLDRIAIECDRRGISYGQYQIEEYRKREKREKK